MSGIEATADVMTGGLAGWAVEPRGQAQNHGHGHGHGHGAHGLCLNCGTALAGAHCHACGQAGHVHRTAGAIGHEIAHGVFHFEGKIWRTLPMLVFRPGDLTRRYVAGERVRFVSPLAVFLFTVFLMFAIVAHLPGIGFDADKLLKPGVAGGMGEARAKLVQEQKRAAESAADLRASLAQERAKPAPDAARVAKLGKRIAAAEAARRDLATAARMLPGAEAPVKVTGNAWIIAKWEHAKQNPSLVLYKIKSSAYKYSWALIPLSVPFLWLLFPFSRRFGLYDHAVFATYSLAFMSLLTIALAVLGSAGVSWGLLAVAALLIVPIHIYKQMKGTYSLRRWSALARTSVLLGFIGWLIVPLFVVGLVYLGIAD